MDAGGLVLFGVDANVCSIRLSVSAGKVAEGGSEIFASSDGGGSLGGNKFAQGLGGGLFSEGARENNNSNGSDGLESDMHDFPSISPPVNRRNYDFTALAR